MVNSVATSTSPKRTCVQCRIRKVRCDGQPDFCGNCKRLRFDCSFQRPSDNATRARRPSPSSRLPLEKRRVSLACTRCRSRKIRCQGQVPACANCVRRDHRCIYVGLKKRGETDCVERSANDVAQDSAANAAQPALQLNDDFRSEEQVLPDCRTVMTLVEAYFENLYPLPEYAFLHQNSLVRRYLEGSVQPCLILALCAVTAQLLKLQPYYPGKVSVWAKQAESDLMQNIGLPSIPRLQALILVIKYIIDTGQFSKGFMLTPLTARAAAALHLHQERPNLHFLAQETRRRLMWSCALLDGQFSVGLREYEMCHLDVVEIQLPCPEHAFRDGIPTTTAPLRLISADSVKLLSLGAAAIRMRFIRRDIMKLTRSFNSPNVGTVELMRGIHQFENELQCFYLSLGESDRYSPGLFSHSAEPVRLLLVHLSWHQAYCDLNRIFLAGYREAVPSSMLQEILPEEIQERRSLCLQHASAIVDLLREFPKSCNSRFVDFDTAICAYHSARLILFISGCYPAAHCPSQTDALQMVHVCQSTLDRYFGTTPIANPIIKDLDDLITGWCSARRRSGRQLQQHVEIPTDDNEATQGRIRQQLAIHSLIRQANFDNDGGDDGVTTSNTPRSKLDSQLGAMPPRLPRVGTPLVLDSSAVPESPVAKERQNVHGTRSPRMTRMRTRTQTKAIDSQSRFFQEEAAIQPQSTMDTTMQCDSHSRDEPQNNMQLAYNPWMGFSDSLESYGLTLSLDDDYF